MIPIWGYEEHAPPGSTGSAFISSLRRILSDTLREGNFWTIYSWSGKSIGRKILINDTTITTSHGSFSPDIAVEAYFSSGPPFYFWLSRKYHAKDVGLIRKDINDEENSIVRTMELVENRINW